MFIQIADKESLKDLYIDLLQNYGLEYANEYYTYFMPDYLKKAKVITINTDENIIEQLKAHNITQEHFIKILIANLDAFKIIEDKVLKDSFLYTSTIAMYPTVGELLQSK